MKCLTEGCGLITSDRGFCARHTEGALEQAALSVLPDREGDTGEVLCPWCGKVAPWSRDTILRHHRGAILCGGSGRRLPAEKSTAVHGLDGVPLQFEQTGTARRFADSRPSEVR